MKILNLLVLLAEQVQTKQCVLPQLCFSVRVFLLAERTRQQAERFELCVRSGVCLFCELVLKTFEWMWRIKCRVAVRFNI